MDCSYSKLPAAEDIESNDGSSHHPIKPKPCKAKRRVKRCFKVVLKMMCVLFLFFFAAATFAGIRMHKWIAHEVKEWTVTQPQEISVVKVPKSELKEFKNEAKTFGHAIQDGKAVKDFVVPARILNGIVSHSDFLHGNVFGEMKRNEVKVDVSLPMDGVPGGKGRYLVGTETLTWDPESSEIHLKMESSPVPMDRNLRSVPHLDEEFSGLQKMEPLDDTKKTFFDLRFLLNKMDGEMISLEMISGQFLDWTVPQDFIDEHINLLEDAYHCDCHDKDCKEMRKLLLGIDTISLEDGQVVVHPRKPDHMHRGLAQMDNFVPSNKPGWKFDLGRRLVGF